MNKQLQEIINYLQDGSNYDKVNLIQDLALKHLKGISLDELGISWDDEVITGMETFTSKFFDSVIECVTNVIESYKEEL